MVLENSYQTRAWRASASSTSKMQLLVGTIVETAIQVVAVASVGYDLYRAIKNKTSFKKKTIPVTPPKKKTPVGKSPKKKTPNTTPSKTRGAKPLAPLRPKKQEK